MERVGIYGRVFIYTVCNSTYMHREIQERIILKIIMVIFSGVGILSSRFFPHAYFWYC